jgi:hypothetical protein
VEEEFPDDEPKALPLHVPWPKSAAPPKRRRDPSVPKEAPPEPPEEFKQPPQEQLVQYKQIYPMNAKNHAQVEALMKYWWYNLCKTDPSDFTK